ncbi:hypothetical protein [Wolbachia endosymbiont of Brugia pahangi]|uniref:hypothetical protein n=1 Tax=Wolbachia endosymbiont of Brugia pahangi TaxID=96495 RepID=UPI0014359B32|nr:hypothetical protein [Wolbachia endosymbiont of Brugia pahangi]QIT36087.1 hypothetical protein WBP_0488 [Wolbachia endosymbiont of Brugia pahangi]
MNKFYNERSNSKNPSILLKEIVVKELANARVKIFLEKVREINLLPNNVPSSSMSHTSIFVLSPSNVRVVGHG